MNATIVGVLFITATVAHILAGLLLDPVLKDPDYLNNASANENRVVIGVLLELIAAGAVVGTGVMLFPVFKKFNEGLALGYASGRSIEGVIIIIGAIGALLLLTLGREYVAGAPAASYSQASSTLLLAWRGWALVLGPMIVLSLNTLILNYLFFQSELIPRFLSVWGLIGAVLILAAGLLVMFGRTPPNSMTALLLALPVAVYEMVLAIWLIVKGFN